MAFIIYQPVLPDRDCVQSAERRDYLRRRGTRRHDVSSTYASKTQREGSEPPRKQLKKLLRREAAAPLWGRQGGDWQKIEKYQAEGGN